MHSQAPYLGRDDAPPGLRQIASGKVRDIYEIDDERLLFVTTDRVSAFDVVMREGIQDKGRVLNCIAAYWFEETRSIVANHLVTCDLDGIAALDAAWRDRLRGRSMIVRRAQPTAIEWVVRGYIAGSGWKEYQRAGTVCGIPLPAGLSQASRLPEPILTPTTKDEDHDRPLTPDEARALVGEDLYSEAERISLELFEAGTHRLAEHGIILADTKFEFGHVNGELVLIDEALTPDSSRFWPSESWRVGESPKSFDKQILRDYLETLDWDKNPPAPELDPDLLERVAQSYLSICERITGRSALEMAR